MGHQLDAFSSPDRSSGSRSGSPRKLPRLSKAERAASGKAKRRSPIRKVVATSAGQRALDKLHKQAAEEWQAIRGGWCGAWFRQRLREYTNIHGYVSAGVSALLLRCATAHANADYLTALGYSMGDHELVLKAQSFASTAKGMELAAYEIACREGRAKRDSDALRDSGQGTLAKALSDGSGSRPKAKAMRVEADVGGGETVADVDSPSDPAPRSVIGGAPISLLDTLTETLSQSLTSPQPSPQASDPEDPDAAV